jgi:hypothetical protein
MLRHHCCFSQNVSCKGKIMVAKLSKRLLARRGLVGEALSCAILYLLCRIIIPAQHVCLSEACDDYGTYICAHKASTCSSEKVSNDHSCWKERADLKALVPYFCRSLNIHLTTFGRDLGQYKLFCKDTSLVRPRSTWSGPRAVMNLTILHYCLRGGRHQLSGNDFRIWHCSTICDP